MEGFRAALPPLLPRLLRRLAGSETLKGFAEIVRELLPEDAATILAARTEEEQVGLLANRYSGRYHPIHEYFLDGFMMGDDEPMDTLVQYRIPLHLEGITGYELHDLHGDWEPANLLMACLAAPTDSYGGPDEGIRVTWLESLAGKVDPALLARLGGGWPLHRLEALLHDTDLQGAVMAAEWVNAETGSHFLDANDEDGWENPSWTLANAILGAQHWRAAEYVQSQISRTADWLREDLNGHLGQLLDYIEQRDREVPADSIPPTPRFLLKIFGEDVNEPTEEPATPAPNTPLIEVFRDGRLDQEMLHDGEVAHDQQP